MTQYFVGPGGSDAANGLSYANRKLTLTGVEDVPVVAGDLVHVAPGVYRELLTIDVSGTAGNAIEYRADVTGHVTDGVGGIVRITGSDNDSTATRASCITATSKNYRTFTGFAFDLTTGLYITLITNCSNWILQDCYFGGQIANASTVQIGGSGTNNTIRRCIFAHARSSALVVSHSSTVSASGHLIENCLFLGAISRGMSIDRVGGITVTNCLFYHCNNGIRVATALAAGQTTTVRNCILLGSPAGAMQAITAPGTNEEITENYNTLCGNTTDRTNVSTGANSNAFPPLFNPQLLLSGFRLPQLPMFGLSEWSPLRAITGTSPAADDLFGITRPATAAKLSWSAVQYSNIGREVTTVRTGVASLKLADAGKHQIYQEVTAVSTTISIYVRWETDYAGTKPSMVIKQPGQSDITVTATGASGSWELLTHTWTPAATPGFVVIELVSENTATSGSYATYWDDLVVS